MPYALQFHILRLVFLRLVLTAAALALAVANVYAEEIPSESGQADSDTGIVWYDAKLLGIEGRGWDDTKVFYDRLPAKADSMVRDAVWNLSRDSAGMAVRFRTDSDVLRVRWELKDEGLAMPHMAATGVSGVDLYARDSAGKWRWAALGRPTQFPMNEVELLRDIPGDSHEFMLYLPLYNGVKAVEIGIEIGSVLDTAPARDSKPLLFYGTSITHGACASRTGMVHTAILGRWFDREVINLGFSGNGKMEPELAELLAELDPAVYILDCLPNMVAKEISERVVPFVHTLREAHPDTPILLVEDRSYQGTFLRPSLAERNKTSRAAYREAYEQLQDEGVEGLHYLEGGNLLGDDGEATVDSSHPNDLGFMRQAEAFRTALEPILKQ